MTATVAVIGGGYGGTTVAKALDDVAEVALIEPKNAFVHNTAALRALVDPQWIDRIFFEYHRLLDNGKVLRDRAVRVDGEKITLGSGEELTADYLVLATGSGYPFPAKMDTDDTALAKRRIQATHRNLISAKKVLLLGAGAAGLELAGEIKAAWPEKSVTVVARNEEILPGGLPAEFRTEIRRQLTELGVELVLGTSLEEGPPSEPGVVRPFTAVTLTGQEIKADIWFRCFGVEPATGYLAGELARARDGGRVAVDASLRVAGQERVFALGDITDIDEAKMARAATAHANVIAANIRAAITGSGETQTYQAASAAIVLPLGPKLGASFSDESGLLNAEITSQIKGAEMMIDHYREVFRV